jgi:excisionase family DNA binding protein
MLAALPTRTTPSGHACSPSLDLRTQPQLDASRAKVEHRLRLRMPTSTVYELARKGVLPASRLGRTWRFLRPRLEELLAG